MKKCLCLITVVFLMILLSSCSSDQQSIEPENEKPAVTSQEEYVKLDNGNIAAPDGTEYIYLASEGFADVFGSTAFLGKIKDEKPTNIMKGIKIRSGMYSCETDADFNVLKRISPDSEWASYYRKASLPEIDLSPDHCIRFEFIGCMEIYEGENGSPGIEHMSCDEGVKGKSKVKSFLSDVRKQKSPDEAGLYELLENPDGSRGVCYEYGSVYGYFKGETNLAIQLKVRSYNDKAYTISFMDENYDEQEYVLPEKWLSKLEAKPK